MSFKYSGGCRWDSLCAADVTMDPATGDPLSCKNPITGAEISGGGGATAKVTLDWSNTSTGACEAAAPYIDEGDGMAKGYFSLDNETSHEIDVILYEGKALMEPYWDAENVTLAGDCEYDEDNNIIITGDCSITYHD